MTVSLYNIKLEPQDRYITVMSPQSEATSSAVPSSLTDIKIRDLSVTLDWSQPRNIGQRLASIVRNPVKSNKHTKPVLNNLTADISGGSVTAIIGGSGCGKTTLLSIISQRLTDPNLVVNGSISYNGVPVHLKDRRDAQIYIPYVVQDDILIPQLSVKETLEYAAEFRLQSMSRKQRQDRVQEVIRDLCLTSCAQTRIGDASHRGISGGEKRRTSGAIQMLTNSSVLFLDEPTTGLDAASALQVVKVLKTLADKGKTVVLTSKSFREP